MQNRSKRWNKKKAWDVLEKGKMTKKQYEQEQYEQDSSHTLSIITKIHFYMNSIYLSPHHYHQISVYHGGLQKHSLPDFSSATCWHGIKQTFWQLLLLDSLSPSVYFQLLLLHLLLFHCYKSIIAGLVHLISPYYSCIL